MPAQDCMVVDSYTYLSQSAYSLGSSLPKTRICASWIMSPIIAFRLRACVVDYFDIVADGALPQRVFGPETLRI